LPFPRFSAARLKQLDGKLRYPPPGSPDFNATEEELAEGEERLSAEPLQEEAVVPAVQETSPDKTERT
jgi:MscS family membrane protein